MIYFILTIVFAILALFFAKVYDVFKSKIAATLSFIMIIPFTISLFSFAVWLALYILQ